MCYSSGLSPLEFWECTMEEALLCYRGKVDEWRLFRAGIDVIHCSLVGKDRADMTKVIPLPFDEEFETKPDDLFAMYREYKEQLNSQDAG